jgi:hypothetical protein
MKAMSSVRRTLVAGLTVTAVSSLAASAPGCLFSLAEVRNPADGGDGAAEAGSACGVPFSPTGPWCSQLPNQPALASNSDAVVATLQSDIAENDMTFGVATDTFSAPIYVVDAGTPRTSWAFDNCGNMGSLPSEFASVLQSVPTPAGMVASMGTNAEVAIYDPAADEDWEFWVALRDGGQWSACWGGSIASVSTNPGFFTYPLGATGGGLPLLAYLIRITELQQGVIAHAIGLQVVTMQSGVYSWPANRTDGASSNTDSLMMGQRLRLDPTFDIGKLPPGAERTIAKAMQDYGMIVSDVSGAVGIQAEDDRPYMAAHDTMTSPYDAFFGGSAGYTLPDIPVGRFQVLPKDYAKSP